MADDKPLETISVDASLTESGVSVSVKSRFISALDRLFGGVVGMPAAAVHDRTAKAELKARLDRERTEALARLELDGELKFRQIELAAEYVAKQREAKRLLNLAAVSQLALEDLRESGETQEETGATTDISDDWLNWFQDFAEKASSDQVRTLWGKILAGEARRPGRFSVGTLRTLAEVDQTIAALFQKYADHLFWEKYIIKDGSVVGDELLDLTTLEDAGLLREVNGQMGFEQNFPAEGKLYFDQGDSVLALEAPPNTNFRIAVILLSRAGRELFSILPRPAADAALRRIAQLLPNTVTSAKLGRIVSRQGDAQYQWIETESLRSSS